MDNRVLTLKKTLKRSDDKMYYDVPFEVPEGVERMVIAYEFTPEFVKGSAWNNEVYLAVTDTENRDVGTKITRSRRAEISSYHSDLGYDKHALDKGIWHLYLCAGRFITDEINVTATVTFYAPVRRWYAGDTHIHSIYSDGSHTYDWLADRAIKNGLDFLAITDHNRPVHGELPDRKELTLIPGVELTFPKGHSIFWGKRRPYSKSFICNEFEEWEERKNEAVSNGAVCSICHPKCVKCPWLWELDNLDVDIVEVWNGPMRPDNQRCIDWWHSMLVKGRRITPVGGSDYHNDFVVTNLLGLPATFVMSEGRSSEAILKAISEGRTSISSNAKRGTFIEMRSGNAVIGDTVKFDGTDKVTVSVKRLRRGQVLRVYDKEGVMFEHKAKRNGDFRVELDVRGTGFVRADVKREYKGILKLVLNVILKFMIPEQAFKPHPPMCTALCAPIYFE